jgi:hypothetical protein
LIFRRLWPARLGEQAGALAHATSRLRGGYRQTLNPKPTLCLAFPLGPPDKLLTQPLRGAKAAALFSPGPPHGHTDKRHSGFLHRLWPTYAIFLHSRHLAAGNKEGIAQWCLLVCPGP